MSSSNPTKRIFGIGSFKELESKIASFKPKTILLILGKASFKKSAHYPKLAAFLKPYTVIEAPSIPENPTIAFTQELINTNAKNKIDLVLGIGGGSVLDVAKTVAATLTQKNHSLDQYIEKKANWTEKAIPYIAVPTTAGTGSEVTPYASLETNDKKKISLSDSHLYADTALLDPELTYSVPPYVTASTGLDALSQAIESYWSKDSTSVSEPHALKAISLIVPSLEKAVKTPNDTKARSDMLLGSSEAGLAIAITRTTAVHSVSYPITTHFGIIHGHACALTLPSFIRFNASVLENERGTLLWKTMSVSNANQAADWVEQLMDHIGVERSLGKAGIPRSGLDVIIQNGFRPDRVKNNPRELTPEALKQMLEKIY